MRTRTPPSRVATSPDRTRNKQQRKKLHPVHRPVKNKIKRVFPAPTSSRLFRTAATGISHSMLLIAGSRETTAPLQRGFRAWRRHQSFWYHYVIWPFI
ncbi:hypothetical protein BO70DRAFT_61615 [Aspergillus heteromorphus CBS 117.55]|uniref:Uncharacterized protein n=1 Tax=Aspergillus heteromorphus CBS 117.55 TaxID=1448321 RepID=A0A317VX06_9EURO|nr:uncharacterized protein BO70DRAFT_61615 [Aspergillus heteromorphus CBS 117.55]PWY78305.1 hypothetical protein BO70DRAFT_61615 [Aspergillus heteromorphus CBS 117.55]